MSEHENMTNADFAIPCGHDPELFCWDGECLLCTISELQCALALERAKKTELESKYLAVGEVAEFNDSLMVVRSLHPQIELDTLEIGSKVYIALPPPPEVESNE